MRRFVLLIVDVTFILTATLAALYLRRNFDVPFEILLAFLPYLAITGVVAAVILPLAGFYRTVWRFSVIHDYLKITGTIAAIVLSACAIDFVYERLEVVSRALPFLQFLAANALLTGSRALHRLGHLARDGRRASSTLLGPVSTPETLTVLVVGISRLTEIYLQAAAELAPGRVKIAGLVGNHDRHSGRLVASYPVLGIPEDIEHILNLLDVHGIHTDRIAVALRFSTLSPKARDALLRAVEKRKIGLHFLAEDLGFDIPSASDNGCEPVGEDLTFEIPQAELTALAARPYWRVKRVGDAIIATLALLAASPIMLFTAILVAATMGFPIFFWQQRPGLGGRPFRLYKFRTMRNAISPSGRRLADWERQSLTGNLLRRLRLDEFPQFFNILWGDMSFVGPRPLLAREQREPYRARLLVRPGLTGWAQTIGGRAIPFEDKAALDVWYVRNASFALDIEIALRTVWMVLFGERISRRLIAQAWNELNTSGILKGELAGKPNPQFFEVSSQV
jgi:lipopolysaccharide/colanic/teichoic acid biosynthesis glycosyltransferase